MGKPKRQTKSTAPTKPTSAPQEALANFPAVFTREQIVQGGTNGITVLRKPVTLPSGEKGTFCHLPLAAKVAITLTRIPVDDKEARADASMCIISDHICDEKGKLMFSDAHDAGEIPLQMVTDMATAMMGSSEDPTETAHTETAP